jgi:hypothetical protein
MPAHGELMKTFPQDAPTLADFKDYGVIIGKLNLKITDEGDYKAPRNAGKNPMATTMELCQALVGLR